MARGPGISTHKALSGHARQRGRGAEWKAPWLKGRKQGMNRGRLRATRALEA